MEPDDVLPEPECEVEVEGPRECLVCGAGLGLEGVEPVVEGGGVGVLEVVVVLSTGGGGGGGGAGGHDSETDFTGMVRLRDEMGAPGGSWK